MAKAHFCRTPGEREYMRLNRMALKFILLFLIIISSFAQSEGVDEKKPVPTHADAAVIIAKYSGLFERYVSAEASVTDCVAFLNKNGIYFGLMEVVNGTTFTKEDCARVMGQIELVLAGEAEYVAGKVKLPKGIDSWMDFCTMQGVQYEQGYQTIVQSMMALGRLGD